MCLNIIRQNVPLNKQIVIIVNTDKLRAPLSSNYYLEKFMSENTKIFHNPRCSKSRAAMDLLTEKGIEADVVKYLETPPDRETLVEILELLNMQPRDLMRKGEAEYSENNLSDESLTRDQLIDSLVEFPKLLERPIVIANGKAAIGRPIENIIDIL